MRQDKIIYFAEEQEDIFCNWFTLIIVNDTIEENYNQKTNQNKTAMIIYIIIQTIILFCGITLFFLINSSKIQTDYYVVEYYGFICIFFSLFR